MIEYDIMNYYQINVKKFYLKKNAELRKKISLLFHWSVTVNFFSI